MFVWENEAWLSNGAKIPIKDLFVDSTTGRILHAITGDDTKRDSTDPYRFTSGNTTDITDVLTNDEKQAIYAMAKSFDLGSARPAKGLSPAVWIGIGVLVFVGLVIYSGRQPKAKRVS